MTLMQQNPHSGQREREWEIMTGVWIMSALSSSCTPHCVNWPTCCQWTVRWDRGWTLWLENSPKQLIKNYRCCFSPSHPSAWFISAFLIWWVIDWWWICAGHCGLHGVSVPGAVSAFLCSSGVSLSSPLLHLRARVHPSFVHPHRSDGESSSGHQQSSGVRKEGVELLMFLKLILWESSPFLKSVQSAAIFIVPPGSSFQNSCLFERVMTEISKTVLHA